MNHVSVLETPRQRVVGLTHIGPYPMIGEKFGQVAGLLAGKPGVREAIGIDYNDPRKDPPEGLRSFAGMFVDDDFVLEDARLEETTIEGGRFAVWEHCGSYAGLTDAWQTFCAEWLPQSGLTTRSEAPFEVYRNDCEVVPEPEVRTDLFVVVE